MYNTDKRTPYQLREANKQILPLLICAAVFFAMTAFSAGAAKSAATGVHVCLTVILPSLLPFFVLAGVLSGLGLPSIIGRAAAPLTSRLLNCSGDAASAFVLGLSGGYPLGAKTVCEIYENGAVTKKEAERILGFCNNSGPAFIVGAMGGGIFHSAAVGLLLFLSHILSALLVGIITRGKKNEKAPARKINFQTRSFFSVFPEAVRSSVTSCAVICGFVVFFMSLGGVLDSLGLITRLSFFGARLTGLEPSWIRSLFTGILELGSGVASMNGLAPAPINLSLASFILGFGGLSVHCQTLALTNGAGLSCTRHFWCRLLHGIISYGITAVLSVFLL